MGYSGHTSGANVVVVVTTFTVLASICCILRLWTRLRISRQPGIDDALCAVATALTILLDACMCMQVKYGMGRHMSTLTPHEGLHSLIWFYVSIPTYTAALGIVKLSVTFQCLRIFGKIDWSRRASIILIAAVGIFTIWTVFISIFLCQPIEHFWKPKEKGKCLNKLAIWFFIAFFSIITDIATAVLPLPVVKNLSMSRKQRILLSCIFGLGGVVCVISIVRFHSLYAIAKSKDVSYDNPLAALWATMEINIGIIACCLPVLKGLVVRVCPRFFSSLSGGGAGSRDTPGGRSYELRNNNNSATLQTIGSARTLHQQRSKSPGGLSALGRKYGGIMITAIEAEEESGLGGGNDGGHGRNSLPPAHGIQVTTTVEQSEEERRRKSSIRPSAETRGPSESGECLVPPQVVDSRNVV